MIIYYRIIIILIMKTAFYSKLDAYLTELDVKRKAKHLITAETHEKMYGYSQLT